MEDFYKRNDISKDTVELTITMPNDSFSKSYDLMLKDYAKDSNIKGFRKGNVPTNMIDNSVKEAIKLETFDRLAPLYVNTAISKEKLEPIAPPEYKELPKIMEGLDITFTVKVTVMPEFKLGNMKKVKVNDEKAVVEDSEIEDAIKELKETQETKEKEVNDKWAVEIAKLIEAPEVKTLDELKVKIRSALLEQKEHMLLHKKQDDALRSAIELTKIEIPEAAIDYEARERERSFTDEMGQRKVNIDDFLKANNISMDKMRELWKQDAKDALESDAFLGAYAKENKLQITDQELNDRIEDIKKSQPDADPSIFSNEEWKEYIRRVETKEKAYREFIKEVLGEDFLDEHSH